MGHPPKATESLFPLHGARKCNGILLDPFSSENGSLSTTTRWYTTERSNLTPKINFLNKLNLVTSTPINGNLNKTYTIQKEVNLKQELLDSIREYQRTAVSQLKNRLLEKIANAYMRPNNEQTDLTFRNMASPETGRSQCIDGQSRGSNKSETQARAASKEKEIRMEKDNDNALRKDPLKEEEDKLLEKSIIS